MKKVLCWVSILLLSVSLWVGPIHPAQAQTPWYMFLYCQPEGGFLQLNIVPDGANGLTWRGHGTLNNAVINISGRSNFRVEAEHFLSFPSNPPSAAPLTVTFRSLEEASRGQSQVLGQVPLKDIRVYPQEASGYSGKSNAMLLVDNPIAAPQLPFGGMIPNCQTMNLTTLRSRLTSPSQRVYGCSCSNPNLPPEMSGEPSSGPTFTDWRDRTGEVCRVSARVEGTFTCR